MSGRARSALGLLGPLAVSLFLVATAIGFLLTPLPTSGLPSGWEPTWYLCGLGLFGIGALLAMSTLGRVLKARRARREEPPRERDAKG